MPPPYSPGLLTLLAAGVQAGGPQHRWASRTLHPRSAVSGQRMTRRPRELACLPPGETAVAHQALRRTVWACAPPLHAPLSRPDPGLWPCWGWGRADRSGSSLEWGEGAPGARTAGEAGWAAVPTVTAPTEPDGRCHCLAVALGHLHDSLGGSTGWTESQPPPPPPPHQLLGSQVAPGSTPCPWPACSAPVGPGRPPLRTPTPSPGRLSPFQAPQQQRPPMPRCVSRMLGPSATREGGAACDTGSATGLRALGWRPPGSAGSAWSWLLPAPARAYAAQGSPRSPGVSAPGVRHGGVRVGRGPLWGSTGRELP